MFELTESGIEPHTTYSTKANSTQSPALIKKVDVVLWNMAMRNDKQKKNNYY